jgi:hypothetical protein
MATDGGHDPGLGHPSTRTGYRWERRAGELRLRIPLVPPWRPVLLLGFVTLVAAVVYPVSRGLMAFGMAFELLAFVSGVVLVYGASMSVFYFVGAAYARVCPSWVRRSGNPFAITVGSGELTAEWPGGRTRRIPRDAVMAVTARDLSDCEAEVSSWSVTVAVAGGPPLVLRAGHDMGLARWLTATLCRALRLPAESIAVGA